MFYTYDPAGNITHIRDEAQQTIYFRNSRVEPTTEYTSIETYTYDAHGSMTTMPHLPLMQWDYRDQLQASSRQVRNDGGTPETTYYVYDGGGQRVRKVTERAAAPGVTPTRMNERIYLGGFEIYREYGTDGSTVSLERETLHLIDGEQRVALVETRTQGDDGSPAQLIRYQLGNHLGSSSLELDEAGEIISYEEYYPYGSTSYQAVDKSIKAAAKRYRYTGMERDEETGLAYHGGRYYAPWLGRWCSADPAGLRDGPNLYSYVRGKPLRLVDPSGLSGGDPPDDSSKQLFISQSDPYHIPVTAGWKSRGITGLDRLRLRTAVAMWGGPAGDIDAGHPKDRPFVLLRKGETVSVYAQSAAENRRQAGADRALGDAALASGGYKRIDGADTVSGPGGSEKPSPAGPSGGLEAEVRGCSMGTPAISVPRPTLTLIGSSPGSMAASPAAADAQLNLPYGPVGGQQLPLLTGPGKGANPGAIAQATVSALAGEQVGLASSANWARAGNATLGDTRATLPEVAAAETAFTVGAMHAHAAGYGALGTLLEGGAAAMPAVGAGLLAGVVAGNAGEQAAVALGASPGEALGSGAVSAALAGAGALIGSAGLGVSAVPGAVIGGVLGLAGYGLSKLW